MNSQAGPPTMVIASGGVRGILTVLPDWVIAQSSIDSSRWARSEIQEVRPEGDTLRLVFTDGKVQTFAIESGDPYALFDLLPEVDEPTRARPVVEVAVTSDAAASQPGDSLEVGPEVESLALLFEDGAQVPLRTGATYVLGRQPDVSGRAGAEPLAVDRPGVSRSHALVEVAQDRIVLTDLGSSNGTLVHPDGGAEVALRPDRPVPARMGTRVGFGDEWCTVGSRAVEESHANAQPADWYPNPSGAGLRYWDGHSWTDHTSP